MSQSALSPEWIYHLTTASQWDQAEQKGLYVSPSLAAEGFIHFSYLHQVEATANLYFQDQSELVLLGIDPARLKTPAIAEPSRNGDLFPHLYAPLHLEAVVCTVQLHRNAEGRFQLPVSAAPQ